MPQIKPGGNIHHFRYIKTPNEKWDHHESTILGWKIIFQVCACLHFTQAKTYQQGLKNKGSMMDQEIFTLKQLSTRSPHVPGKQSCGKAIRSMSFGTTTSSGSGAFCSPLKLLTFSILGLSFFFRKDRRLPLLKLLPALITCTSSLLIKGGTNTERTSGSSGGRFLSFLWVPCRKKNNNQNKH